MTSLLLLPLDDTVVFPTMDVTLPVDAGDEERVLLIPRHDGEFAKVGTIAEVTDRVRLPGGGRAVHALRRRPRRRRRRAHRPRRPPAHRGRPSTPDDVPVDGRTRTAEREYRAVVEEILELRGADERVGAVPARDRRARRARRHDRLRARRHLRAEGPGARDARRHRAPRARRRRSSASGSSSCSCAARSARTSATAPSSSSASTSCASRWSRSSASWARTPPRSSRSTARRSPRPACPRPSPSRRARSSGGSSAWASSRPRRRTIRSYLDWLIAVPWSETSDEKLDPVDAREVLDADHAGLEDVKDRIVEYLAVKKLRVERGIAGGPALRRDPDADRPARHRQDVDRRVDRPRDRAASSSACRSAACATRPRSAATGARTSARSRAAWCARCATPGR